MSIQSVAGMRLAEVPCPVCGSVTFDLLASQDRYYMGITTVRCTGCGLILTNPQPTPKALDKFYRVQYRSYYRKTDSPTEEYVRDFGLAERARYTADHLEGRLLFSAQGTVLDAGCAEGTLLREIKTRCPEMARVGVEPHPAFAEFASEYAGCEIVPSLDDLRGRKFDLIIVNHVLEHVPQPTAFLEEIGRLLGKDGVVYLDVPDVTSYRSLADLHIAHLYHFSPATLAAVVHKAGLVVREMERHTPPRHPRSLRTIAALEGREARLPPEVISAPPEDIVRKIARRVWFYRLVQRAPIRRFLGAGNRLIKAFRRGPPKVNP